MSKFVVLTRGRTGSSAIVEELDSHPQVVCHQELARFTPDLAVEEDPRLLRVVAQEPLGPVSRELFRRWFDDLEAEGLATGVRAVGFKLLASHIKETDVGYNALAGVRAVHLKRRNVLRQVISGMVALKSGWWNSKEAPQGGRRLHFDPAELLNHIRQAVAANERVSGWLAEAGVEAIDVYYEDFLEDRGRFFAPVFQFLGVDPAELAPSTFQVMITEDLPDLIENWDEICDRLRYAGMGEYLDGV